MDKHRIYLEFALRFGEARAEKFLLTLHRESRAKGRLYFWQEQMLAAFNAGSDVQVAGLHEALDIFNICHVHGLELAPDRVGVQYGIRRPLTAQEAARAESHPFARFKAAGPCWVEAATQRDVWFCAGCRTAYLDDPLGGWPAPALS